MLAVEGDETSVAVDMADRLDVDIITRDGNDGADVQSEIEVLVQKNIAVRIKKQKERVMAEIDDVPLVVRKPRRESKPTQRLLELREFLSRKAVEDRILDTFTVKVGGIDVLQTFHETMKDLDVWWEQIMKEFNMMKVQSCYDP